MELNPLYSNILAVIAMIAGIALGAWWLIGLYGVQSRKEEKELPETDLPVDLHEVSTGIPPVLVSFYALIALALIVYVLYIWLSRASY